MISWHRTPELTLQSGLCPAVDKQRERLRERKEPKTIAAKVGGFEFLVQPRVYHTSIDTELMVEVVRLKKDETFLEIGCGCGAVTLLLAMRAQQGVGVDINEAAVENSRLNQSRLGIANAEFIQSDVFSSVGGSYDILVCNPPYNQHEAEDLADRMFWDPNDEMKVRFFAEAKSHLKPKGRIYFGWGDFADLESSLPLRLARAAGFRYRRHFVRAAGNGLQRFLVFEFALP
jgi:release factor glutamine methyltransferase